MPKVENSENDASDVIKLQAKDQVSEITGIRKKKKEKPKLENTTLILILSENLQALATKLEKEKAKARPNKDQIRKFSFHMNACQRRFELLQTKINDLSLMGVDV